MKIAVFEVDQWERQAFESLHRNHDLQFTSEALSEENADHYADVEVLSTFIYSDLNADILRRFHNLKLIATRSTGFDHIVTDYCKEKGIVVCNVPTYGENTVAEHVFGLLLAISHHLIEAVDRTRRGDVSHEGLQGFDLRGKTLGVVGTGDIGRCVIEIAKGFRMEVLAFDVKIKTELASELGFRYVDMDELITPHTAFYTREAVQRILSTTVHNIDSFTRTNPKMWSWAAAQSSQASVVNPYNT